MASGSSDPSEASWWGSGSSQWLSSDSGQWLGSVLASAKDKSAAALSQMSKDLKEFGSTIQQDTTHAVAESAVVISENLKREDEEELGETGDKSTTERVREGFLTFLSSVSQNLAEPEKIHGEEFVVHSKDSHVFDQTKARLHAMQVDPATYCTEPDGPSDAYHEWLESFNVEDKKGDISELLVANSQVRSIYTKLVPAAVSHAEFWGRYYYKGHQLNQDEARRNALKERAEMTSSQTLDDDLGWGDEEDTWDTIPEASKLPTGSSTDSRLSPGGEDSSPTESKESEEKSPNRTQSDQSVDQSIQDNVEDVNDQAVQNENDRRAAADSCREEAVVTAVDGASGRVKEMTLKTGEEDGTTKKDRSPTESSHGSSGNKESSLGDEWEKDFDDIEITEEDIKNAQLATSKNLDQDDDDDDWENWD